MDGSVFAEGIADGGCYGSGRSYRGAAGSPAWAPEGTACAGFLARSTIRFDTTAISWESALQDAPVTVVAAEEFPVRGWLLELLEPWADVG